MRRLLRSRQLPPPVIAGLLGAALAVRVLSQPNPYIHLSVLLLLLPDEDVADVPLGIQRLQAPQQLVLPLVEALLVGEMVVVAGVVEPVKTLPMRVMMVNRNCFVLTTPSTYRSFFSSHLLFRFIVLLFVVRYCPLIVTLALSLPRTLYALSMRYTIEKETEAT